MAHYHLGLASSYADYFTAGGGGDDDAAVATVVVPEEAVDARVDGDRYIIYGHHHQQQRADEALFVPVTETMGAHSSEQKAAFGGVHFVDLGEHVHHRQQQLGRNHSTTTLTLREPADASSPSSSLLMVHQPQRQLGGGARHRNHHWRQAWPQEQEQHQQGPRGSRFLLPTQQLLHEFCSLPVERDAAASSKAPPANVDDATSAAPSARIQAMDAAELQRLKAKLYTMIDEVDRRYRRYREQMWAVAGSFEAIAGAQAAAAYSRLASRTISRHFRTLRDGVAAQVEAVRRALGEKDTGAAGVPNMRETTPRLRALDQCLRQNRAYYLAGGVLDSQPWRPQRGLPERAVSILRAWLFEHFLHPYPSDVDKRILAHQTGLSRSQVSNWFINARVRLWKPMVEEMYAAEEVTTTTKDDLLAVEACCSTGTNVVVSSSYPNRPACYTSAEGRRWARGEAKEGGDEDDDDGGSGGEMKPTPAQLMVVHDHDDAGSLASVVSIGSRDRQRNLNFGVTTTMDHLGFGAYDDVADEGQGFVGGGGVSLTLGLQHVVADPNRCVNVAFAAPAPTAAAAHSEFMFLAGGGGGAEQQHMGVAGGVYSSSHHFGASVDDGDTGMRIMTAEKTNTHHQGASATTGFQLLHDLAG